MLPFVSVPPAVEPLLAGILKRALVPARVPGGCPNERSPSTKLGLLWARDPEDYRVSKDAVVGEIGPSIVTL